MPGRVGYGGSVDDEPTWPGFPGGGGGGGGTVDPNGLIRRPSGRIGYEGRIDDFPNPGPTPSPGGSYSERVYSAPSTALDAVIPMVYGSQRVPGFCAAWNTSSSYLDMAFIFCFGEQNSLTTLRINDEAVSGLSWVTSYNTFLGTGSGTQPSYMTFMSAGDWTTLMQFACLTMRVAIKNANCPGSFQVTAIPTGRKFASFRSPYTVSNHTNLAEIGYDILTASAWKGLTTPAGTEAGGTWERFADHCDEVMGDASKRYTFNGVISERDPDAALRDVLSTGFAAPYFSSDGKYQIWSEAPPPAITGTWSAAGTTVTEDASSGAALTDLAAGDIVYVGTTPCIVSSVTNDDTFVVDRSVTQTSKKVRKTSGVYLKLDNWVSPPAGREIETGTIPDEVVVRYTLSNYWGAVTYPTSPSQDRRTEITVEGCNNHSMARRISETQTNLMSLQPFFYQGVADATAAGLEPGDVFFFDDDVLTFQPARVAPPVSLPSDGNVALSFQTYDVSAVSDSTATNPTIPTQPTAYVSSNPPHFDAINSVTVGGTSYNLFRWDGSDATVGDDLVVQVLDGVSIRLPNDVALLGLKAVTGTVQMLKVNSSDQLQLGDGTVDIFLNSPNFVLPAGGAIQGSGSPAVDVVSWKSSMVALGNSSTTTYIRGSSSAGVTVTAPFLAFDTDTYGTGYYDSAYRGVIGRTSSLTTTELPNSYDAAIWRNTSSNEFALQINYSGTIKTIGAAAGSDSSAIHDDVAGEINAITSKGTPVSADVLVIEDSEATYAKKKITLGTLPTTDAAAIHDNVAAEISVLTNVTAATGDHVLIEDLSDSNNKKRVTCGSIAALVTTATDADAIHDNASGEINAIVGKGTPVGADILLIEDSAASYAKAKITLSSVVAMGSTDAAAIHDNVAAEISAITAKTTPVAADLLLIEDSAATNAKKRMTVANLMSYGATDAAAIHDNVAGEIAALTGVSAASNDQLLIEDASASNVKRSVLVSSILDLGATDATAIHDNVSSEIYAITNKATPAKNDVLVIEDSAATYAKKRITVGALPYLLSDGGTLSGSLIVQGDLTLTNTKKLYIENTTGTGIQCVTVDSSNLRIFGWTTGTTWVEGATLKMYGTGYSGTAGPPTTTQWTTAGSWGIHVDTDADGDAGLVYLVYRHGTSIRYKLLDNT